MAGGGIQTAPCPTQRPWVGGKPHSGLVGCVPRISCPILRPPTLRDFWTVRQEKTLALAHALQTCAERSGMLTRVLCDSVRELTPLMCLSRDEIVEVSLLEPAGEEHGTSPTLEEEAILPG